MLIEFTCLYIATLFCIFIFFYKKSRWDISSIERLNILYSQLFERHTQLEIEFLKTQDSLLSKDKELQELKSSKKSTEVRTGQIVEHWAPFLDNFEYNPKDAHFVGNPIDYVVFSKDESGKVERIVFVEIKSGDSKLSKVQREIRDTIKAGKVFFEELSIK